MATQQILLDSISERELEVIQLLRSGLTNQEIADRLFLAKSTVKWYVRQLNQKFNTSTREEIVEAADKLDLLKAQFTRSKYMRPRHNLPHQTTPFVGRDDELDEIHSLLDNPDIRLLTILAPGGMGKTRVALEAAEQQTSNFADGVYFVPLQGLIQPSDIMPKIAQSIGLTGDDQKQGIKDQVLSFLKEKYILLVLDNYEHLLDGATIITTLLHAAAHIKIMTTSRERLNLLGEVVYMLHGMQFPSWETPEDALEYDAVKLLSQAARTVTPNWQVTEDNLHYVARTCRLTQGMPLGILLAASWLNIYPLERICTEIQRNIDILETQMRDVPERQRSIRAIFDHTWANLSDAEQEIFASISIFKGGATTQAIEQITNASPLILQNLVNKALLNRDGDGRYQVHELLRQYAYQELETHLDLHQQVQQRHCEYYLEFLAELETSLKNRHQKQAAEAITTELENIREAWRYASETHQLDLLDNAMEAFIVYAISFSMENDLMMAFLKHITQHNTKNDLSHEHNVVLRSRITLATTLDEFRLLVAEAKCRNNINLQMKGLFRYRYAYNQAREPEKAIRVAEQTLDLLPHLEDDYERSRHFRGISLSYALAGDMENYTHYINKSYRLDRNADDVSGLLLSAIIISSRHVFISGDLNTANRIIREAITLSEEVGSMRRLPYAQATLAMILAVECRFDQAKEVAEQALQLAIEIHSESGITRTNIVLALLTYIQRDFKQANYHIDQLIYPIHNIPNHNYRDSVAALIYASEGRFASLVEKLDTIFNKIMIFASHSRVNKEPATLTLLLPSVAYALVERKQRMEAVTVLSTVTHHPDSLTEFVKHLPLYQQLNRDLRRDTSPDTFAAAWERGKSMSMWEVIRQYSNSD